jgi:small subunit ribosomal protein S6
MAQEPPLYDLVVLLDSEATEEQATKVLNDCERIIKSAGEIVSDQDWGLRALAYEIRHKSAALYHLMQFHAPREVLEQLDRMLHIADGVVRYRIIKLKPGTPPPPSAQPVEEAELEPEPERAPVAEPEPEPEAESAPTA